MRTLRGAAAILALGLTLCTAHAADPSRPVFDHQALPVKNLAASAAFYTDVLLLEEIENKTKRPDIRWFSLGGGLALHLIEEGTQGIAVKKALHVALTVADFDGFLEHLDARKIAYSDWTGGKRAPNVRADGVRQIYLQDPDGYWIEVNDAKGH